MELSVLLSLPRPGSELQSKWGEAAESGPAEALPCVPGVRAAAAPAVAFVQL